MKRNRNRLAVVATAALCLGLTAAPSATAASAHAKTSSANGPFGPFKNVVVIYQENHSFDNLYGEWGKVGGDKVNGTRSVKQVTQDGKRYDCLLQNDVNLTSPNPLPATCTDASTGTGFASHFRNGTFTIDDYIPASATTCPAPGTFAANGVLNGSGLPGGCTKDLVHRFYQEQYQINGGKQDRYVTGSDAAGLTMGSYDTKKLPIYQYLHGDDAPNYVLADNFHQAAYGGSFLNHQYLIAARAPLDTSAGSLGAKNSVVDANGMPTGSYPLYKSSTPGLVDGQLTVKCPDGGNDWAKACGNFAVNTVQPSSPPFGSGAKIPLVDDAKYPNIGDRMTDGGVSWNWYSGGWADAAAGKPGPNFQYHHQPFNYFANYAPGQPGRDRLKDEKEFIASAKNGTLPQISFVKPYGDENEHPGYASEPNGSDHLVELLKTVTSGPQADDTLVVVTYDEFGGQFDHASPTARDKWGDGSRIPALLVSSRFAHSGVDHTNYDTVSIMASIEHQFDLPAVDSRDKQVNDLRNAVQRGFSKKAGKKTFAVIGDIPYGDQQIKDFPNYISQINDAEVGMTFHVGDIKNGSSRCDNSVYTSIKDDFNSFERPLIYTPGDNEWTDCHRANNGAYNPLERLAYDRSVFFDRPNRSLGQRPTRLQNQGDRGFPENARLERNGVQFATIHVVGSNDDLQPWTGIGKTETTPEQATEQRRRMKAAIANVKESFAAAKRDRSRAVVILTQADMFDPTYAVTWKDNSAFQPLVQTLIEESNAFKGETYLVNGDSHVFNADHPVAKGSKWLSFYGSRGSSNLTRITVDGSGQNYDWLRFTFNDRSAPTALSWERVPYLPAS